MELRVTNGGKESIIFIAWCDLPDARKGCVSFYRWCTEAQSSRALGRNMLDKCFPLRNVYLSDMIPFM